MIEESLILKLWADYKIWHAGQNWENSEPSVSEFANWLLNNYGEEEQ